MIEENLQQSSLMGNSTKENLGRTKTTYVFFGGLALSKPCRKLSHRRPKIPQVLHAFPLEESLSSLANLDCDSAFKTI
jgi:hypothetical protein